MNQHERLFRKTRDIIPFLWLPYFLVVGIAWIAQPAVHNRAVLVSARNVSAALVLSVYFTFVVVNQFAYFRWTGKYPFYRLFPKSRERVDRRSRELKEERLQKEGSTVA